VATSFGRSSEGDKLKTFVVKELFADFLTTTLAKGEYRIEAIPVKHISHNLSRGNGDQRNRFTALPDHVVTTDQSQCGVPARDGTWEVESRNDTNGAKRVPLFDHHMSGAFTGNDSASNRP